MLQDLTYNTRLRKNKEADYYSTEIRKEMVEKSTILVLTHLQPTNMEELKNLKETILAIQKYSQEVVDAKGALKRDKILAQGAVYAYDKVLYYIKEIEQEKLQAQ